MNKPPELEPPEVVDRDQLQRIEATHRGFLYQHLYGARCLLLSGGQGVTAIVVEGDEDLEIVRPDVRTYVQVKMRRETLGWSDIEDAVERFSAYRALHATGQRAGRAEFVIASNARPGPALLARLQGDAWPQDIRLDWPAGPAPTDPVTPAPPAGLAEAMTQCRQLAAGLPFAMLAPETLVWKLAGVVMLAAAGGAPRDDHAFSGEELAALFEQLAVQLQDFPAPPAAYRAQLNEPALLDGEPVRLITGYSGAGKTAWVAQAAQHVVGTAAYFNVADIPGPALASNLARDLAARIHGQKGGLGQVLLPGASGLEILQALSREQTRANDIVTVVLDNVHYPSAADLAAAVRAAPGLRFVLLGQPGGSTQELAARLQAPAEALAGWSPDTIAAEAAAAGCRADAAACQALLELTGGLPLYVQNAVAIAAAEYGGALADFCADLARQTHSVETAQELILARIVDSLPDGARTTLAALSLSDIPLERKEVVQLIAATFGLTEPAINGHLRRLRTAGAVEVFGGDRLKVHDAIRVLGRARLTDLGAATVAKAHEALRDVLSASLEANWEYRKLGLYLLMLAETGEIKTLVQFGTDELFHEMGLWPIIRPYLETAAASDEVDAESRFWALDGIVFNDMRVGEEGADGHIALMKSLVEDHDLGVEERLAVGMKEMNIRARAGDAAGVRRLMTSVAADLKPTPAHRRIFRYNAAVALLQLGEFAAVEDEAADLIDEYYGVLGITPADVMGRNPDKLRPLLKKTPTLTDDLKHLADTLDVYAKAVTAQRRAPGLARIHAMKFYDLSQSPESTFRLGQDLADEFVERNDFIGAREVFETNLLPMLQNLKLASYIIPVRSQYAVVLGYCGEFDAADAEMARLAPYEAGLSPAGQGELQAQRRLIADLRRFGPPPQWQLPAGAPRTGEDLRGALSSIRQGKIGRNAPCPCGSGKKFKKCHG